MVVGGIGAQVMGFIPVLVVLVSSVELGAVPDPVALEAELTGAVTQITVLGPSILLVGATMAGVALLAPIVARAPVRASLGLRGAPWPAFLLAPLGILALGPTSDALRRLAQHLAPGLTFGALEGLDAAARSAPLFVIVPLFALVPGIAEELLFRGALQSSIRRRAVAIPVSGLLFAAYHTDPHHVAAVVPLGLYLAWLRDRTNSTWVPIAAHITNNAIAVIAAVTLGEEAADEPLPWWALPIGLAVASACIAGIVRVTRPDPGPSTSPPAARALEDGPADGG